MHGRGLNQKRQWLSVRGQGDGGMASIRGLFARGMAVPAVAGKTAPACAGVV
jgi:hypothetical protein